MVKKAYLFWSGPVCSERNVIPKGDGLLLFQMVSVLTPIRILTRIISTACKHVRDAFSPLQQPIVFPARRKHGEMETHNECPY